MSALTEHLKRIVAAFLLGAACLVSPAAAEDTDVAELLEQLRAPDTQNWQAVEHQIYEAWSRSGSAAMDLLLRRGRDAMEAGDLDRAIEHFSALIDHAPDFAEAWNARAMAYFQAERLGLAVADVAEVLRLNPDHFAALMGLGQIMEELGYENEALEAYRAAHAIHPHRPDLREAIERLERAHEGTRL